MKIAQLAVLICLTGTILACGQKGALVMPDQQKHKRVIPTPPAAKPANGAATAPAGTSPTAPAGTPATVPPSTPATVPPDTPATESPASTPAAAPPASTPQP
jgi:predicted small lipoprotein YifL